MKQTVPLPQAYRLLNHGPTVLVCAASGGRRNVMAAAWAMPLDFDPPKVAVVIDKNTYTRGLIEASGCFTLNVPCRALADATFTVGSTSAKDEGPQDPDKFDRYGLATFEGPATGLPLIEGCVAWLECRVLPEPRLQQAYDLFLGAVVAAQADVRVFSAGRWHFEPEQSSLRTLHHFAGGAFFSVADQLQARRLP